MDAVNCVYYCTQHFFQGSIQIVDPTPSEGPPTIQIVSIIVSTNIVVRSTGTNTWSVLPEYTTDFTGTNWLGLTVQANTFDSGTNETICGKPDGDAIFIRIRSQRN